MVSPAPIETVNAIQRVKADECEDAFLDVGEPFIASPLTFGGRLLAQSVLAAQATVPDTFGTNSMQTTFLRPGRADVPATYRVERTFDSKGSASRTVRAVQGNIVLCISTIRLAKIPTGEKHRISSASYGTPMPDVGSATPESLPVDLSEEQLKAMYYPIELYQAGPKSPLEFRHFPFLLDTPDSPLKFRMRNFWRSEPIKSDKSGDHAAGMAWAADVIMPIVSLLANYATIAKLDLNLDMRLSLQQNMIIHDPAARIDEWMVSEAGSSFSDGNKILLEMKMWNYRTGKLIVTANQEYLVALSKPKL